MYGATIPGTAAKVLVMPTNVPAERRFVRRVNTRKELTGVITGDVEVRDLTPTGMKTEEGNRQGDAEHRGHSITTDITDEDQKQ